MTNDQGSTNSTPTDANQPATPRKPRWLRRLVITAIVLVVMVIGLALLTPTVLSSGWGRGMITKQVNAGIAGQIEIDSIQLAWFGGQTIGKVTLRSPQGEPVATVDELQLPASLWSLATGGRDLGEITISSPHLTIVADEDGQTNLMRALAPKQATTGGASGSTPSTGSGGASAGDDAITLGVSGSVRVTNARIEVTQPKVDPVEFTGDLTTSFDAKRGVKLQLTGKTTQGELRGDVQVDGSITGFDEAGRIRISEAKVEVEATVTDLPVAGLDGMIAANGMLTAALGQRLNLNADSHIDPANGNLITDLRIDSDHLNVRLDTTIDPERRLTGTGRARLNVTQPLVTAVGRLAGSARATTTAQFPVEIRFDRLAADLAKPNPMATAINASFTVGDGELIETGGEQIGRWLGVSGSVQSDSLARNVKVDLQGDTRFRGQQGSVKVAAEAMSLFASTFTPQWDRMRLDANADLKGLPIEVLDRIAKLNGQMLEAVGPTAHVELTSASRGTNELTVKLAIESPRIERTELALKADNSVALSQPTSIRYYAPVGLIRRYLPENIELFDATGRQAPKIIAVDVQIDRFQMPRPKAGESWYQPGKIRAALQISSPDAVFVQTDATVGKVKLSGLKVTAGGASLKQTGVALTAKLEPERGVDSLATAALGSGATVNATAQVSPTDDGQLRVPSFTVKVDSERMKADVAGRLSDMLDAATISTVQLNATMTPALARKLGLTKPDGPQLARDAQVRLEANDITLPLKEFTLAKARAAGSFQVDQVTMTGIDQIDSVAMTGLTGTWSVDGPTNRITAQLAADANAQISGKRHAGKLTGNVNLTKWLTGDAVDMNNARGTATLTMANLPTALLDGLTGQANRLQTMIGPMVNVQVTADLADAEQRRLETRVTSERLTANAKLTMGEEAIELVEPADVQWLMIPQAYAMLTAAEGATVPPLTLQRAVQLSGHITQFSYPVPPELLDIFPELGKPLEPNPSLGGLMATATAGAVALRDVQRQGTVTVSNLKVDLVAPRFDQPAKLTAGGDVVYTNPALEGGRGEGKLAVTAYVYDYWKPLTDADVALEISGNINAEADGVPIAWVDQLMRMQEKLVATLGPTAKLIVKADLKQNEGPIRVEATSELANAKLVGRFTDGAFTLDEDLVAVVKVTPELGEKVLADANFLLKTAYTADQPIRLTVPAKGVSIPLYDKQAGQWGLDMAKVNIPIVQLELGKITMENDRVLQLIMKFARRQSRDKMVAEFTPIVLGVQNGRVSYLKRGDLLIDDAMHLVTFGQVDLVNRQLSMTMGFTKKTLDDVFGLESLPDDAVFQIPVAGPITKPEINFGAAAGQMASLQAKARLSKENPLLGALAGGALEQLLNGGKPKQLVPPPSVTPLPWADRQLPPPEPQSDATDGQSTDPNQAAAEPEQPAEQPTRRERDPGRRIIGDILKEVLK